MIKLRKVKGRGWEEKKLCLGDKSVLFIVTVIKKYPPSLLKHQELLSSDNIYLLMPFPLIKIKGLATFILFVYAFIFSFDTLGQNIARKNGKLNPSFSPLIIGDKAQSLSYATLDQAKQTNKTSYKESRASANCNTNTFYLRISSKPGDKINLQDVQTLPNGDFIAAGNVVTANGDEEGLIIRLTNAGDIVSQNRVRINNKPVVINAVKVWPAGNIVIAGIVANSNAAFIAELKNDLSTNWINVTSLASKPVKVAFDVSDYEGAKIDFAVQLPTSIAYSSLTTTGQLLWSKEVQVDGLSELVGFNLLNYDRFGLVADCVRSGEAITEVLEIDANSGTLLTTHVAGDGSTENKALKTITYSGRLKMLSISKKSPTQFTIVRDIFYTSAKMETKHTYSLNRNVDFSATGAMDNAGDAMGICLPNEGKMIFIRQFADYFSAPEHTREYSVPIGTKIASVSRSFDGGYLFGLSTENSDQIIFIKTDSTGVVAGCNYADVRNDFIEEKNKQNTAVNRTPTSVNLSSSSAIISLSNLTVSPAFDCRQTYCPTAPLEDVCLSTYYKTFRSNSYVDAFASYYLMQNNNQIALTQRFDRVMGGQNRVTIGLKLFDEKGQFIKGVNVFLDGVSTSAITRKMDDKSIMVISYSTKDNIPYYTFTLVSDDLQIQWSKSVKTYLNYEFGSNGFSDLVKDEEGNYYMVASGGGFSPSKPKVQVYKMDRLGNQLWLKTYELNGGYTGISSATTTKSSLIMICEVSGQGSFSVRIDKNTGAMVNSFSFKNTWSGGIYHRLLQFDKDRIYYAGDNGKGDFAIALFGTTARPYKFKSITGSSILRAGTVKDGNLYAYYVYYNGTKYKQVLLKADSNLNVKYSNEYEPKLSGYPTGMGISDNGSIYMGGNYSYSGYLDPFIIKFSNIGEMGTCGFTPSTSAIVDVDVAPAPLTFSPLDRTFQPANIPITFVPDNNGQAIAAILCSSAPQCDYINIDGKPGICKLNDEYTFTAKRNASCNILPIWTYDTAFASVKKTTDSTITYTFKKTGNTWLRARLNTGCMYYEDSMLLQIQQAPAAFSLGNDTTLCPGDSLRLAAGNDFNSYLWSNASTSASIITRNAGKYFVTVFNVCKDVYSDTIVITSAIIPSLNIGIDTTICLGDTIIRHGPNDFKSYNWSPGSLAVNDFDHGIFLPKTDGKIILSAITKDGCPVADTMIATVISARPVYLGSDTSFCSTDSIALFAGNGFDQYKWNTGSTAAGITIHTPGTYSVIAHDPNGCYAKDTLVVKQVYAKPVVELGNDFSICIGSTSRLDAGDFESFKWHDGSTDRHFIVSAPGSFWVTATDKNKCSASDTVKLISMLSLPANFLQAIDSLCDYDKIQLQPTRTFSDYSWSTGARQAAITINKPGYYRLVVTDTNGCRGSDTTLVVHKDCMNGVYIPTAFTPNKDGFNDVWRAKVFGNVISFQLTIYNRFGQTVFSTTDPFKGWDGNLNGLPQDSGGFVYQCSYQLQGSKKALEKGTILLIR